MAQYWRKHDSFVNLRLPKQEKQWLLARAKKSKLSLSSFIRKELQKTHEQD